MGLYINYFLHCTVAKEPKNLGIVKNSVYLELTLKNLEQLKISEN